MLPDISRGYSAVIWQSYEKIASINYAFNKVLKAIRTIFDALTADFSSIVEQRKREVREAESVLGSVALFVEITLIPERINNIISSIFIVFEEIRSGRKLKKTLKEVVLSVACALSKSVFYFTQIISIVIFKPISFAAKYLNIADFAKSAARAAKVFSFIGYGSKAIRSLAEIALGKRVVQNLFFVALAITLLIVGILSLYYSIPSFVIIGLSGVNALVGLYKSWRKIKHLTDYQSKEMPISL